MLTTMMMIRHVLFLLVGPFVMILLSANSARVKGSRLEGEHKMDVVIQHVAKHLWSNQDARPFLIKGSYAAFAWANEHEMDIDLLYNDIDVFVETNDSSKCPNKRSFVSSRYVQGVVPDTAVQITTLCNLDANALIKQSDINAVNVGFLVVPKKETNLLSQVVRVIPEIESWIWTEHFEKFIESKTLEVVYPDNGLQTIMIRLMYKAQQLELKYKFLPDDLLEQIHGAAVAPNQMAKYNALNEAHKTEITSRFDLVPIPEHNDWYTFVLKERDTPRFPRILARSTYDSAGYGYGVAAGDNSTTLSPNNMFTTFVRAMAPAVAMVFVA